MLRQLNVVSDANPYLCESDILSTSYDISIQQ